MSRMKTKDNLDRLREWFATPTPSWLVPEGDTFAGVAVYERLPENQKPDEDNRIGLATGKVMWDLTRGHEFAKTMPASAQPHPSWKGAPLVGFATSFEEAVTLLLGMEGGHRD